MKTKRLFFSLSVIVLVMGFSSVVCAGTISGVLGGGIWTGWTQFQDNNNNFDGNNPTGSEDYVSASGKVDPGRGGQDFDAEYLFYKLDGNTLSLGLQTGFDVVDGKVTYGGKDYYTGDIALDLDNTGTYDYAVDFGLLTKDYYGHNVAAVGGFHNGNNSNGTDAAGLYSVTDWNTHVLFSGANPFAMDGGSLLGVNVATIASGSFATPFVGDGTAVSFYRQVSFDIGQFLQDDGSLLVDAHWTMSCGNDAINGTINVPNPEPATIALLGIGLAGLAGGAVRKKLRKSLKK